MVQYACVVQPPVFHDRPDLATLHPLQTRSPNGNSNANLGSSLDGPDMVQMHQSHARHVRFETMVA
jgi:hypothetical protein